MDVRHPLTGVIYPAGTPLPMTAFARKVLTGLPAPTGGGTANNYVISQLFDERHRQGRRQGGRRGHARGCRSSAGIGWRDVDIVDDPPIPLPSGGDGNATTYVENTQLALGATYVPRGTSLFEVRFGWSETTAGKNPAALGQPSALDAYGITGLPTTRAWRAGCRRSSSPATRDLGRQATNPQWQYPTVFNPKINYSCAQRRATRSRPATSTSTF